MDYAFDLDSHEQELTGSFRLPGDPPLRSLVSRASAPLPRPAADDPWGDVRHACPPLRIGQGLEAGLNDRRRARRLVYTDGWLPPTALVVPGQQVIAVNLSETGMLVEAAWHMKPNRLVEVRLQFPDYGATVLAEVVRAYVNTLDRSRGIRYRAAVAFATRVALPRDSDMFRHALRSLEANG